MLRRSNTAPTQVQQPTKPRAVALAEHIAEQEVIVAADTIGGIVGADGSRAMSAIAWYTAHPDDLPGYRVDSVPREVRAQLTAAEEACEAARVEYEAAGQRRVAADAVLIALRSSSAWDPRMGANSATAEERLTLERRAAINAVEIARAELEEARVIYERALPKLNAARARVAALGGQYE